MNNLNKIAIIIPALNPNEKLIELVKELKVVGLTNIIVIDDGSRLENKKYFLELKKVSGVTVYENEKNYGKGRTIKKGIEKVIDDKEIFGLVTVDADGQHLASDARKIAEKVEKEEKITFGERKLKNKDVPLFSRIGRIFSTWYLKLKTGVYLEDTQTGLRGIPRKYFDLALQVSGDRFDYEMNFLEKICDEKIEFDLVDIETIYKNRIKNFRIFKDSYIIYKEFFKNLISSILASVIDVFFFWIFIKLNVTIRYSNIVARILSGIFDFTLNKKWVFKNSDINNSLKLIKYSILFIIQMMLNTILVEYFSMYAENLIILKIIINISIYIINFFIKKIYIFKNE